MDDNEAPPHVAQLDVLIEQFNALVEQAKQQALGGYRLRLQIQTPPEGDAAALSLRRRWFYGTLSTKFYITFGLAFAIGLFLISLAILAPTLFGIALDPNASSPTDNASLLLFTTICFIVWVFGYGLWWEWAWRRAPGQRRPRLGLSIALLLGIFGLLVLSSALLYEVSLSELLAPNALVFFALLMLLGFVPSLIVIGLTITYLVSYLMDVLLIHENRSGIRIKRLLADPIFQDDERPWHILEMDEATFHLFKNWAANGRDNAEKRLIPAGLTLALFGLLVDALANLESVSTPLDRGLRRLILLFQDPISLQSLYTLIAAAIGLAIILAILGQVLALFSSMVAHSLLVEVFTVAEALRPSSEQETAEPELIELEFTGWRGWRPIFRGWRPK